MPTPHEMSEGLPSVVLDCACGLRYMRSVWELTSIERASAHCSRRRLLGDWQGRQRLVFEPEEPSSPAIITMHHDL